MQLMPSSTVVLLVPVFMLLWLCVGLGISFYASQGWRAWAARFAADSRPVGRCFRSPCTLCHPSRYERGAVHVVFSQAGVYLHVPNFFSRWFCRPLLIPWTKVDLLQSRFGLCIADFPDQLEVVLPSEAKHELARYYHPA
ncbi:MAG: hypothetical protein JWM16_5750 [Verrucomicrobiales bacterium]|nr:hypothetical protein [Verrucomicrobiales bacterium]